MSAIPMQLVAVFKASDPILLAPTDVHERRRRCRHCGYVNVFKPLTPEVLAQIV